MVHEGPITLGTMGSLGKRLLLPFAGKYVRIIVQEVERRYYYEAKIVTEYGPLTLWLFVLPNHTVENAVYAECERRNVTLIETVSTKLISPEDFFEVHPSGDHRDA